MENPSILPPQGRLKTGIEWKGEPGSKPGPMDAIVALTSLVLAVCLLVLVFRRGN